MAFLECRFFSESLRLSTSMSVILPQRTTGAEIGLEAGGVAGRCPVLYLLHGLSDDHTIWSRRTSIERYAAAHGLAVVMPEVHRSFYCDMIYGGAYWTYLSEELPRICPEFFPIDPSREATFACGFSMGGYGAFKLGLACGDRFAAVASLAGALDMASRLELMRSDLMGEREWTGVLGPGLPFTGGENDLFHLATDAVKKKRPVSRLFQHCGRNDFLYENNQTFRKFVNHKPFTHTYEESDGGHHWGYVDTAIQRVLNWLPLPGRDG